MDPALFAQSPSGSLVRIEGDHFAFVPNPLPPDLTYTPELVAALSQADRALGGVASIPHFFPNWRLLMMPFLSLEAVMSSRIEGTHTTTAELLASTNEPDAEISADTQEVRNYLRAMSLGVERLASLPLVLRLVRELHAELLSGVRGANRTPGEFRRHQVCIGPEGLGVDGASYIPPPASAIDLLMGNWEAFLNEDTSMPPLVQCAVMHAQFEMIHPFGDGNGRIGRLLMSLFLVSKGHLSHPLLFLSPFLEHHRAEYYDHLLAISQRGEWSRWIRFFLRAVEAQSRQAVSVTQRVMHLRNEVREELQARNATSTAREMVDRLLAAPFVRASDVTSALGVSAPTARKAIGELQDVGFLVEITGRRRGRRYCAAPLLDILQAAEQRPPEQDDMQPRLDLG